MCKRLLCAVALYCAVISAAGAAYSNLYVFGDSLSDAGNNYLALPPFFGLPDGTVTTAPYIDPTLPTAPLVPTLAYASGRYSNGPVWAEYFASQLGLSAVASLVPGGTNYAFGSARSGPLPGVTPSGIPTLMEQVAMATGAGTLALPGDALYAVWVGGNDVREAGLFAAAGMFPEAIAVLGQGVTNILTSISNLAAAGARHFLLPNVPDIGLTPIVLWLNANLNPLAGATYTALSDNYNDGVAAGLPGLLGSLPGIDVFTLDVFSFVQQAVANPLPGGNVTDACTSGNAFAGCADPQNYLFWDGIHPSTAAHAAIAGFAYATVVPVPAALPLMLGALGLIGAWRRRA